MNQIQSLGQVKGGSIKQGSLTDELEMIAKEVESLSIQLDNLSSSLSPLLASECATGSPVPPTPPPSCSMCGRAQSIRHRIGDAVSQLQSISNRLEI